MSCHIVIDFDQFWSLLTYFTEKYFGKLLSIFICFVTFHRASTRFDIFQHTQRSKKPQKKPILCMIRVHLNFLQPEKQDASQSSLFYYSKKSVFLFLNNLIKQNIFCFVFLVWYIASQQFTSIGESILRYWLFYLLISSFVISCLWANRSQRSQPKHLCDTQSCKWWWTIEDTLMVKISLMV